MVEKLIESNRARLLNSTYTILIKVTVIIAIPAISSYFIGKFLENRFQIHPVYTLLAGLLVTWAILFRMFININKEIRSKREKV